MKISRRTFLKAITVGSFACALPVLTSCQTTKKIGETISISELADYWLATLENNKKKRLIFVKQEGLEPQKFYTLKLNDNEIVKYMIYDYSKDISEAKRRSSTYAECFKDYFSITSLEPALKSISSVIGIQEEYTSEELKQTLEECEKELNETNDKTLTK